MSSTTWYMRSQGRITGPFTAKQLEALRNRGQLARFHELSQDRQSWSSAGVLTGLFPEPPTLGRRSAPAGEVDEAYELVETKVEREISESAPEEKQWFYLREGATLGPVSFLELQELAARKEIEPACFVWKEGMLTWVNCREVPQVVFPSTPPAVAPPTEAPVVIDMRRDELSPSDKPRGYYANRGYVEPPRVSGLAVASLVLWLLILCGIGSLLAVIFGAVSLSQISHSRGRLHGKGMAVAGLVLGLIELSLGLASYIYFFYASRA
jgi:hypothetical protein